MDNYGNIPVMPVQTPDGGNPDHSLTMPPSEPISPQPSPPPQDQNSKKEGLKSVLYTLSIIIIAPILAISMTLFVFQSYQVDGPSMENTLHNGDRLIVNKVPRTWSKITNRDYIPNRYDVIIFTIEGIDGQLTEKQLVKRVIGLPGDRVVVRDGGVTVFNDSNPSGFNPDNTGKYATKEGYSSGNVDLTVSSGKIFVMGDNRENSLDSRAFGPIDASEVVGKLALRIFPVSDAQRF